MGAPTATAAAPTPATAILQGLAGSKCDSVTSMTRRSPFGIGKNRIVTFHHGGVTFPMAVHPDDYISNAIASKGSYGDVGAVKTAYDAIPHTQRRPLLLDVGANVGVFTLYGAHLGFQVISVEAAEVNAARLVSSIRMNDFSPYVTVYKAAAGEALQCLPLTIDWDKSTNAAANMGSNSLVVGGVAGANVDWTTVVPVADLVPTGEVVDFFKLDVEGFECRALLGAAKLFQEHRVKRFHVEVNYNMLRKGGCSGEHLRDILEALCMDVSGFSQLPTKGNPDFQTTNVDSCTVSEARLEELAAVIVMQ